MPVTNTMNIKQNKKFDFLEASPEKYNNKNNCGFVRPYILDFGPLVSSYSPASFDMLISKNLGNSVTTPYTLLIQVALGYLDAGFSLINSSSGRYQFDKLVRYIFNAAQTSGESAFFIHQHAKPEYGLNPGWISAMTQGQALSLWVRIMELFDDFDDIQPIGPMLLNGMLKVVDDGGGLYIDPKTQEIWLEEYPSNPPSHVLNGYVFAFFGLLEVNRNSGFIGSERHQAVEAHLQKTLFTNIYKYDQLGWSCYDLAKHNFAPLLYHYIHIYTISYLSTMLKIERYKVIADRWRNNVYINKYYLIDVLRVAKSFIRKAYVTLIGRRW